MVAWATVLPSSAMTSTWAPARGGSSRLRRPSRLWSFHTLPRTEPVAGDTVHVGAAVGVASGATGVPVGACVGGGGVFVGGSVGGAVGAGGTGVLVGTGGGTGVSAGGGGTGVSVGAGGTGVSGGGGTGVSVGGGGGVGVAGGNGVLVGRAVGVKREEVACGQGNPCPPAGEGTAEANSGPTCPRTARAIKRPAIIAYRLRRMISRLTLSASLWSFTGLVLSVAC